MNKIFCDRCGDIIKKPSGGYVQWLTDWETNEPIGVQVVHHINSGKQCLIETSSADFMLHDLSLEDFVDMNVGIKTIIIQLRHGRMSYEDGLSLIEKLYLNESNT